MKHHIVSTCPVPIPDWTLHRPVCTCGWAGELVRTKKVAHEQAREYHLDEIQPQLEQPALFDL